MLRRDRHTILLSFVKQLACPPTDACPSNETATGIYKEALQAYENEQIDPSAQQKLPVDACRKLLSHLLKYHKHPVIFLDALDECSDESRWLILSDLLSILKKSNHPVKVFISSRHNLEIEDSLKDSPHVSIEAKDNAQDIENYIKSTITRQIEGRKLLRGRISTELRQNIEKVLQRNANGM